MDETETQTTSLSAQSCFHPFLSFHMCLSQGNSLFKTFTQYSPSHCLLPNLQHMGIYYVMFHIRHKRKECMLRFQVILFFGNLEIIWPTFLLPLGTVPLHSHVIAIWQLEQPWFNKIQTSDNNILVWGEYLAQLEQLIHSQGWKDSYSVSNGWHEILTSGSISYYVFCHIVLTNENGLILR